jgi:hypothetical protein
MKAAMLSESGLAIGEAEKPEIKPTKFLSARNSNREIG